MSELPPGPFRIGQVAELTGVSVNTLRTWERRYGLVDPSRTPGGTREYSVADLERIQVVKALTDRGEAVGLLAQLSTAGLQERLSRSSGGAAGDQPIQLTLVHRFMAPAPSPDPDVHITLVRQLERLPASLSGPVAVELELLGADPLGALAALQEGHPGCPVLILAAFLSRRTERALEAAGAEIVRSPVTRAELVRRVRVRVASADVEAAPRPALSRATLQALLDLDPRLACECPQHVAQLTLSVIAFEDYSRQCADASPEDAALHTVLAQAASDIRAQLEALVHRVCEHGGISIHDLGETVLHRV